MRLLHVSILLHSKESHGLKYVSVPRLPFIVAAVAADGVNKRHPEVLLVCMCKTVFDIRTLYLIDSGSPRPPLSSLSAETIPKIVSVHTVSEAVFLYQGYLRRDFGQKCVKNKKRIRLPQID